MLPSKNEPLSRHQSVTPSDSTTYDRAAGVYCLTAGNCVVQDNAGTSITYPMTAGQVLPFPPRKIMAASTGTYVIWF
jgi:hypothetical protein